MANITHSMTLSTTEPNNNVGLIKVRQADDETQIFDAQITENGAIKSFSGLTPFFCLMAREVTGQGVSEEPVKTYDGVKGTLKYTVSANAMQMVGRNEAYFSFRKELSNGEWSEQFSTRSFNYTVEKSIYTQQFRDSNLWWTFNELYRIFNEYIKSGKSSWEEFVDQNREILESVDPGGTILTELIDARSPLFLGQAQTLKERLDEIELYSYLSKLQKDAWADFRSALFVSKRVILECIGDSITYGFTTAADDPEAVINSVPCDDGTAHDKLQCSHNYPYMVGQYLTEIGIDATIHNCGREGAFSSNIMDRFFNDRQSNLSVVMLGTNDAINGTSNVPVDAYLTNLLKLIQRQLERGSAIMLMTPPKFRNISQDTEHSKIEEYVNAVLQLGAQLDIPVVNLWEELQNLGAECYADNIHPGIKGYEFIAAKATARMLQRGSRAKVGHGDTLGVTRYRDGYIPSIANPAPGFASRVESPAPDENTANQGQYLGFASTGATGYWVFETAQDDCWVIPNFEQNSKNNFGLQMTLDFGCQLRDGSLPQRPGNIRTVKYASVGFANSRKTFLPTVDFAATDVTNVYRGSVEGYNYRDILINPKGLYIAKKGLHVIKLTGSNVLFWGLDVVSNSELQQSLRYNASQYYSLDVAKLGLATTAPLKLKEILAVMEANGLAELTFTIYRSQTWTLFKNPPTVGYDTQITVKYQPNLYVSDRTRGFFVRLELNNKQFKNYVYQGVFKEDPGTDGLYEPLNYEFDFTSFS